MDITKEPPTTAINHDLPKGELTETYQDVTRKEDGYVSISRGTGEKLAEYHYLIDRNAATVIYLAVKLQSPSWLRTQGVGKTELAKPLQQ